ncbi:MAG: hypothetical protein COS57_07040 [Syntrophobacterales bacterium CG03_land_8_20_14_0_80_58_14]|nr:MAG: hypothetical protein COS57_07040 [Syntrophobacterales bacterium CG03_land_8_20_14_0_80_58_14]
MRVIVRHATYDLNTLRPVIFGMMEAMGGEKIGSGSRVLIKPNLLSPALPRQAVLTHPAVVRAVVEYCYERGARPLVADSPAMGSFDLLLRMSGIRDALRGLDCECRPFQNSVRVDIGKPFGAIEIAEDAVRADVIVNLPKLKTHSQMLLTLAVKNLFGCVVGYRKPEWHMRAGVDRQTFAWLIARIGMTLRPAFNILDGVLTLEGQGPGMSGVPRELGVLLAGCDPFALDRTVCRMVGLDPERLPVLKAAREMGFPAPEAEIDGALPEIRDFRLPRLTSLIFGPKFLQGWIRRQLLQRPVCDPALCRMCGECWKICPAWAITPEAKPLCFDYDRCIRCFCCLEVCPFGALRTTETLAGRIVRAAAAVILPPGTTR